MYVAPIIIIKLNTPRRPHQAVDYQTLAEVAFKKERPMIWRGYRRTPCGQSVDFLRNVWIS